MSQPSAYPEELATYEARLRRLDRVFQDSVRDRSTGTVLKREWAELAAISKHKLCTAADWSKYGFISLTQRYRKMLDESTPETLHSTEASFFENELQRSRLRIVDAPRPAGSAPGNPKISKGGGVTPAASGRRTLFTKLNEPRAPPEQKYVGGTSPAVDVDKPQPAKSTSKRKAASAQDKEGAKKKKTKMLPPAAKDHVLAQDPSEQEANTDAQPDLGKQSSFPRAPANRTTAQKHSAYGKLAKAAVRKVNFAPRVRKEPEWHEGLYWIPRCKWCKQNNLDCRVKLDTYERKIQAPACLECARRKATCHFPVKTMRCAISAKTIAQAISNNDNCESDADTSHQERPSKKSAQEGATKKKYTQPTAARANPPPKQLSVSVSGQPNKRKNITDSMVVPHRRALATNLVHPAPSPSMKFKRQPTVINLPAVPLARPAPPITMESLHADIEVAQRSLQGSIKAGESGDKSPVEILRRLDSRVAELERCVEYIELIYRESESD